MIYIHSVFRVLSLLLLPMMVAGQMKLPLDKKTKKVSYQKIIQSEGQTADRLLEKTIEFLKQDQSTFYVIGDVNKGSAWALGRAQWGNAKKPLKLGYVSANETDKYAVGKCLLIYEGDYYECVNLLVMTADLFIMCKDGRVKIELTNFTYNNYKNGGTPKSIPINKNCDTYGTLEDLLECGLCEVSEENLEPFMKSAPNTIINRFVSYLNKVDKKPTDDDW